MSSGMPELGSKISLISKADIRYEGRLFTVDPQECTIALASVRSFGTEDRETQFPVAPQNQVYDYILFRGSDIKDIRVVNNVSSMPNDPAIMQLTMPPSLGAGAPPQYGQQQFGHPVVGGTQYPQYHPMTGLPAGVRAPLKQPSELSGSGPDMHLQHHQAPLPHHPPQPMPHTSVQVKDQGVLDMIAGSNVPQTHSRSATPLSSQRKSPTSEQAIQVGPGPIGGGPGQQRDGRRGSNNAQRQRNRNNSRNRQQGQQGGERQPQGQANQGHQGQGHQGGDRPAYQHQGSNQIHNQVQGQGQGQSGQNQHHHNQNYNHQRNMQHHPGGWGMRGGWRGRGRGGGRGGRGGFLPRPKNTLKFDNEYDFEQANTEFEELRTQLAKTKITDGDAKPEVEGEKKDDSGNETVAGEHEPDDDDYAAYDKNKSFFDNISCEAVERSKGRTQRTDWRTERKLNSETFGVAMARRGAWRGRPMWRQGGGGWRGPHQQRRHQQPPPHHQPPQQHHQPAPAAAN